MAAAFGNYTFLKELKSYTQCKPEDSACRAKKELSLMENVNLNIAVTGESGVGKSTFVNAIRGIKDGEEGAANTGVTETTTYPMKYTHPTMPNVYIWDLPGIGTQNFKAKNYLRTVKFDV